MVYFDRNPAHNQPAANNRDRVAIAMHCGFRAVRGIQQIICCLHRHMVKDTFKFQEKYDEKLKEYVLTHSKITEAEYERMERYEWYMTSDDMLAYGLVDEVIGL